MGTLTALLLATPIFGFALTPPNVQALPTSLSPTAQVSASLDVQGEVDASSEGAAAPGPTDQAAYVSKLRKRAKIAKVHRTLGIATWAATAIAVISGTIQYRNLYGVPFSTKLEDTPCVKNTAWLGQEQCSGAPLVHAIPGFVAGGFYFTTLGLAIGMPDPDHASEGTSKFSKTLRLHKTLRWVHLLGMLTQMGLGIVMANPGLGLDRANDYKTLKVLSGVHLFSGYVTLGALSWAGTIMLR